MEQTTKNRFFPEGITRCGTYECKRNAAGWLLDPEGSPIPGGHSCEPCAQMCIEVYETELGESWTFTTGFVYRTSGTTVRTLHQVDISTWKVIVDVTKEDIKSGHRCNSNRCPVALAIQRALGDRVSAACIRVTGIECEILEEDYQYSYYALPESARVFIKGFDNEKPGDPFPSPWKRSPPSH